MKQFNANEIVKSLILVGYSISEIAEHTKISKITLSNILKKEYKPAVTVMVKLEDFFKKNIEEKEIGDFKNEEVRNSYLVYTPDGWQKCTNFVEKGPLHCYKIKTTNKESVAADKHAYQLNDGEWITCDLLQIGDSLMGESSEEKVTAIEDVGDIECFDITIDHPNHRYYLDGISSHNTGKSLLAGLIMSNAIKQGFDHIFYFDAEGGGSNEFFENIGCDTEKIEQILVSSVEEAQIKILEVYNGIRELKNSLKDSDEEPPKFLCVLDSLGALVAEKLLTDADKGKVASEMGGRAKKCLAPDTLILMSDNTYKQIKDVIPGDTVVTHLGKVKPVLDNFKSHHKQYIKIKCKGVDEPIKMSLEHKMLISRDSELMFCEAKDIKNTDKLISLNI